MQVFNQQDLGPYNLIVAYFCEQCGLLGAAFPLYLVDRGWAGGFGYTT